MLQTLVIIISHTEPCPYLLLTKEVEIQTRMEHHVPPPTSAKSFFRQNIIIWRERESQSVLINHQWKLESSFGKWVGNMYQNFQNVHSFWPSNLTNVEIYPKKIILLKEKFHEQRHFLHIYNITELGTTQMSSEGRRVNYAMSVW